MFIYGIDAWQPTRSLLANALARRARWIVSISDVTARKFQSWAGSAAQHLLLLPNAIHAEWYGSGAKNPALVERYGLQGKTVLMTLGRLVSEERYKGFDEVLEAMPDLVKTVPNLMYLIAGSARTRAAGSQGARARDRRARGVHGHGARGRESRPLQARGCLRDAQPRRRLRLRAAGGAGLRRTRGGEQARRWARGGARRQLGSWWTRGPGGGPPRDPGALALPKVIPEGLTHYSFGNFEARTHAIVDRVLADQPPVLESA